MSIFSICVLAVVTVIFSLMLKPKNSEIALMLVIASSVIIITSVLEKAAEVIKMINTIIASCNLNTEYIAILIKVIGICLITEFAVNTCKDAGSQALACNVSLAGKILATITALPLYSEIFNTVVGLMGS